MKKIRFFWLFLALVIILASCHNPGTPAGTMYFEDWGQVPGQGGDAGSDNPYLVINQLARLQQYAQTGGSYDVWVRFNQTINNTQVIRYLGRQNVKVRIQSYGNTRQTLYFTGSGNMFDVQDSNATLILDNIVLQGHTGNLQGQTENANSLVAVNSRAVLKMNNDSVIRGNAGSGVTINGGTFIMNGNASVSGNFREGVSAYFGARIYMNDTAQIYGNDGALSMSNSVLTMRGNAAIHNNHIVFNRFVVAVVGIWGPDSRLFMHGNSSIRYNSIIPGNSGIEPTGGVRMGQGRIYMYENASIRNNVNNAPGGGGVVLMMEASLNMHGDGVRITGNYARSGSGGGVRLTQASELNISGGLISGFDGGLYANTATSHDAVSLLGGAAARTGTYSPNPDPNEPGTFTWDGIPRASSNTTVSRIGGVVTW